MDEWSTIYTYTLLDNRPMFYFAISSGNWNDPNIWSLSAGGDPAGETPAMYDYVVIDGYEVTVNENTSSGDINLTNSTGPTLLRISAGILTVYGNVRISNRDSNNQCKLITEETADLEILKVE